MADDIFSFNHQLNKDEVLQSIYDVELKAWKKAKEEKPEQAGEEPKLDSIKAIHGKFSNGIETSAEQALAWYASGRNSILTPQIKDDGSVDAWLDADAAKKLGAVLVQIEKNNEKKYGSELLTKGKRPDVTIKGSDGVDYILEPKELSAYLQSVKDGKLQPIDTWLKEQNIGLTNMGTPLPNGDEQITIETSKGQKRTFGNGKISKPLDGYYGDIDSVKSHDGDGLDIYLSEEKYNEIKGGTPYTGDVFVMQEMDKGKPDELKIGYAKDVDEFRKIQESGFAPEDREKIFEKELEGKYAPLTQAQYKELKEAIKQKPDLTLEEFVAQQAQKGVEIKYVEPTKAANADVSPAPAAPAPAVVPEQTDAAKQPAPQEVANEFNRVIAKGMAGDDIAYLQRKLHNLGKYEYGTKEKAAGDVDGIAGKRLEQAVIGIQEQYGLKVNGKATGQVTMGNAGNNQTIALIEELEALNTLEQYSKKDSKVSKKDLASDLGDIIGSLNNIKDGAAASRVVSEGRKLLNSFRAIQDVANDEAIAPKLTELNNLIQQKQKQV